MLLWDISDPLNPKQLSHWKTGATGTHRDGYPGGRYVNLAARLPGYEGEILVFLDVSDPAKSQGSGTLVDARPEGGRAPASCLPSLSMVPP